RAVDKRELRALVGEEQGGRAPHTAGGARDDRDAPFDRAAEFAETSHSVVTIATRCAAANDRGSGCQTMPAGVRTVGDETEASGRAGPRGRGAAGKRWPLAEARG